MKKILAAVLTAATVLSFSGCRRQQTHENGMVNYDFSKMNVDYIQLKPPTVGDKIAIIDTDYGEIRVVLYEQYAPNAVHNFIKNAEEGVYDNMPIKGVKNDVYFLTGGWEDKKGNYIGREEDTEPITDEYSVDLWPFTGALMGYSENPGFNDARWFIVNNDAESLTKEAIDELKEGVIQNREDTVEREKIITMFDKFYEVGGVFGLAGENTVYGQTYLGLDIVKKLTRIPADDNFLATEEVMIKSVTISEFKAGDETDTYPREPLHPTESGEDSESGAESSEVSG